MRVRGEGEHDGPSAAVEGEEGLENRLVSSQAQAVLSRLRSHRPLLCAQRRRRSEDEGW